MGKKTVKPKYMRDALRYIQKWVPRLRIENYDFQVEEAPEGFEPYALAVCNPRNLRACIVIRDPAKASEDGQADACNDLEVTLVHELLHVRFAEVLAELEGKANIANEIATEMIALALVAADRGVHPRSL